MFIYWFCDIRFTELSDVVKTDSVGGKINVSVWGDEEQDTLRETYFKQKSYGTADKALLPVFVVFR